MLRKVGHRFGNLLDLEFYDGRTMAYVGHMLYSSVDEKQCMRTVKHGVHGGQV